MNDNCSNYFSDKAGTSNVDQIGHDQLRACMDSHRKKEMDAEKEAAEKLIQEAEHSKLLVHKPTGVTHNTKLVHHYEIDDLFYQMGAHVN